MTASRFDRLRPRTADAETLTPTQHDVEGKRALFSSTEAAPAESAGVPTGAGIAIDCSRCGRHTLLTPAAALRAAFPALHLSVGVRRGERETTFGLIRRQHGSWLRCPACGRGSWVRVTVRL
jgi:ribosomal protein L37E